MEAQRLQKWENAVVPVRCFSNKARTSTNPIEILPENSESIMHMIDHRGGENLGPGSFGLSTKAREEAGV